MAGESKNEHLDSEIIALNKTLNAIENWACNTYTTILTEKEQRTNFWREKYKQEKEKVEKLELEVSRLKDIVEELGGSKRLLAERKPSTDETLRLYPAERSQRSSDWAKLHEFFDSHNM